MKQTIVNNLGETLLSRPIYNIKEHMHTMDVSILAHILKDIMEADAQLRAIHNEVQANE